MQPACGKAQTENMTFPVMVPDGLKPAAIKLREIVMDARKQRNEAGLTIMSKK